jgi:PLP dependent protein
MANIAENIRSILARIHEFETRYNQPGDSVTLLAVSKTQSAAAIRNAFLGGAVDFGENYLQEALDKQTQLTDLPIRWHFIGPVQANKTRQLASHFHWIHSIDRLKIAQRLSDQRPVTLAPLNVCVQVNISGEKSKSGVAVDDTPELCSQVAGLPHLVLRGLMAIPAPTADFALQRKVYRQLAALLHHIQSDIPSLDTLSMGMSDDFEAAIAEGSTMVRLGTAVFGPRI